MVSLELKRIVLLEVTDRGFILKKLNTSDEDLEKIETKLEFPSLRGMKEYDELGIFDTPKKFRISNLNDKNPYYEVVELFSIDYQQKENRLSSIDEINYTTDGGFKPNLVLYYCYEDNLQTIYLGGIGSQKFLVKDKTFLMGKKKVGTSNEVALEVKEFEKGLDLPFSNFLCKVSSSGEEKFSIEVYDAYTFDSALQLTDCINDYAKKVLERFNSKEKNKFLLTKSEIAVEIKELSQVLDVIKNNYKLSKALSLFRGHGRKTINQIDEEKLKDALEILKKYSKDKDACFSEENIPEFIESDNKLIVSEKQIKIFTALLDNKIVEKILDRKIELPFFEDESQVKSI